MILLNFRKILQDSHDFRKIHKRCSKCKQPIKSNEILMKFGPFSYFSHFSQFFVNFTIFALFHKFPHSSHFFSFSQISQNFALFALFRSNVPHVKYALFSNENGANLGHFCQFGWKSLNFMTISNSS